jgi:hypothetical protein
MSEYYHLILYFICLGFLMFTHHRITKRIYARYDKQTDDLFDILKRYQEAIINLEARLMIAQIEAHKGTQQ